MIFCGVDVEGCSFACPKSAEKAGSQQYVHSVQIKIKVMNSFTVANSWYVVRTVHGNSQALVTGNENQLWFEKSISPSIIFARSLSKLYPKGPTYA